MMQSLAEGFDVLKNSEYRYELSKLADLYDHGSVIESHLTKWLAEAYEMYGDELTEISGIVAHSGEGEWTIKTAEEMKIPVPVIKESFEFRKNSEKNPSYAGKVLSALRNRFGGHRALKNEK